MRTFLLLTFLGIYLATWAQNPEEINPQFPGQNMMSMMASPQIIEETKSSNSPADNFAPQQIITVPQGWSGISGFIIPDIPGIETLFKPVMDKFVILYNQNGMYYPDQNINTLVNWDPQAGYIAKFNQTASLGFSGQVNNNRTITLNAGWNLIPVLSNCPVNVTEFFQTQDIVVVKDVATYKLYWPTMGINTLNELLPGKAYYVLMSAPGVITFPDCTIPAWQCGEPFVDPRDSRVYNTVQIGAQCWMAQNLNFGNRVSGNTIQTNNETPEKYCYDDQEANCYIYGGLYQWDEMMNYSVNTGAQGICMSGWHLPTDVEWCTITTYLDATVNCSTTGWSGTNAGGKMKETGTTHWTSPNTGATNSSGFTGLPGGYLYTDGFFSIQGDYGLWWSSTQGDASLSWHRNLGYTDDNVRRHASNKAYGFSVRCLKDASTTSTTPTVTTYSISNITQTTATSGGDITSDGGAAIIERGVCWNTNANPTISDSHTTDGEGTGFFESILTDLTANTPYFVRAYATNIVGTAYGEEMSFTTLAEAGITCGSSLTINHVAGDVAPVDKTVTYGIVTNIPGEPLKCWITSNLGADHQATSVDDATEESAGWYWQFNRKQGYKHDGTTRTPNTAWITSIIENSDWTPVNDPCAHELGTDWRIPTSTEFTNIDGSGNWTDWNGPWNSMLKMHAAGYLNYADGSILYCGSQGGYWVSTRLTSGYGQLFSFTSWFSSMSYSYKALGLSLRCLKDASTTSTIPTVTTFSISNITQTTATSGGDVISDGGAAIIERGVCWSTNANPTISESRTLNGEGTGVFESNLTELSENTLYFVRAFATNIEGTAYGEEVSFTTLSGSGWQCGDALPDARDNQTYTTVQIGSQCWMAQNLNVGTRMDGANNQTNNGTIEKYCYNDQEANCYIYGGLYQWNEMMNYSVNTGAQGICMSGWHLPTDSEWTSLTNYLGGESVAGGKMKETGTTHWTVPNTGATNSSSFTALPGGYWDGDQTFYFMNEYSVLWSSSQNSSNAWFRYLYYDDAVVVQGYTYKVCGLSVRCLKDQTYTSLLEVTPANQNVTVSAGTTTFDVTSNTSWTVDESVSWLSVSPASGSNNGTLTVTYGTNTVTYSRSGQITVTAAGGTPVVNLTVTQAGAEASLTVSPANQNVPEAAGITTFSVSSNTSWTVTEDVPWFTVTPMSGSNDDTLTVSYTENVESTVRNGEITVTAAGGTPVVNITISQAGAILTCGLITDSRDGKTYSTIQIGSQCWMAQNLNIGTNIGGLNDQTNNGIIEKYCYDDNEDNCDFWGGLYQWDEMMQYSTTPGVQGICMNGWHLPSATEWTILTNYLSSQPMYWCNNDPGYIAKALSATTYWNVSTDECAIGNNLSNNNATGFTALPAGMRDFDGAFNYGQFLYGGLWTSSIYQNEDNSIFFQFRGLNYGSGFVQHYGDNGESGISVRCLKNNSTSTAPSVTTGTISNVTQTTATSGGEVTSDGGVTVGRGVCWSTNPNPTIADSHTMDFEGIGAFESHLTGLTINTLYYVRAYATNIIGTVYGEEKMFTTFPIITIITATISDVNKTTATGGGEIILDSGPFVIERGVCWSTTSNPTIADSHTNDGEGTGLFESNLTDLLANTFYVVRAYATMSVGTAYGNEVGFVTQSEIPCPGIPTVNYSGKNYTTVQIGTQCWIAQNMNIGTMITGENDQTNNGIIEKYCYNNIENNCNVYGGLYQWNEMMRYNTTPGIQGICPTGWHVPYDDEWTILSNYLGGDSVAGGKMKTTGTIEDTTGIWYYPNTGATNSVGFSSIPAGLNDYFYNFSSFGASARFWTASHSSEWTIFFYDSSLYRYDTGPTIGISVRCIKDESTNSTIPTITTRSISSITHSSAKSGGDIWSEGGANVTERGICWSTNANPTIADSHTNHFEGIGSFESYITELEANTQYYVRAYATNSIGTAYGEELIFTTSSGSGWQCGLPYIDNRDSISYSTVQIGTQCWMAQNLNIGSRIDGSTGQSNNGIIEKYCYNNIENNCTTYGGLYQWDELMLHNTIPGVQGICPFGWHVPSNDEWTTMSTFVSNQPAYLCQNNSIYIAKALAAPTNWTTITGTCLIGNNLAANNASGFSGLPGGYWHWSSFYGKNSDSYFWSATTTDNYTTALIRELGITRPDLIWDAYPKLWGLSVRCLRDENTSIEIEVTPKNQNVSPTAGTTTFYVNSNTSWTVSDNVTWLEVTPSSGSNYSFITVTFSNNTGDQRVAAITISGPGVTPPTIVTVTQASTIWNCELLFTDSRDNQVYPTLQIGNQCWMAENMNIGTRINGTSGQYNNGIIEKYCYKDFEWNCDIYGGLYQWNEMMQYNTTTGAQGICPSGWHIPSDAEWTTMSTFVSSQPAYMCNNYTSYIAKALASTTNWSTSTEICAVGNNIAANNATGFTGLPGGHRYTDGSFFIQGTYAFFWSATQYSSGFSWYRLLYNSNGALNRYSYSQSYGFSVRCLKDN